MTVDYLDGNDIGEAGATIFFKTHINGVDHAFIYSQETTNADSDGGYELGDLVGISPISL